VWGTLCLFVDYRKNTDFKHQIDPKAAGGLNTSNIVMSEKGFTCWSQMLILVDRITSVAQKPWRGHLWTNPQETDEIIQCKSTHFSFYSRLMPDICMWMQNLWAAGEIFCSRKRSGLNVPFVVREVTDRVRAGFGCMQEHQRGEMDCLKCNLWTHCHCLTMILAFYWLKKLPTGDCKRWKGSLGPGVPTGYHEILAIAILLDMDLKQDPPD